MDKLTNLPISGFKTAKAFETWLIKNHGISKGFWLKIFKKNSGIKTITYAEALDVALCYGWIDGQKQAHDETAFLQKFTPRTKKSIWSKKNTEHIERLTKDGRMQSAGLKAVEDAKADGRWENAYDSSRNLVIPEEFLIALRKNKKAETFFKTLSKTNLFPIGFRLQTAKKPETRQRRIQQIIAMLEKGETFH